MLSQDDSRFGLLPVRRRRLPAWGVHPVGPLHHVFEWCYAYGAVAPATGERFCWELPSRRADLCQPCMEALAHAFPDSLNSLLLDHSGAHTAPRRRRPAHVRYVGRPPYGPELNPSARVWRDVQEDSAWCQCAALEAQPHQVGDLFWAYEATALQSLTGYAYVVEAIHALR